ncbi:MAG: hypothetical protein U0667_00175 [Chloroflexota bacterium]
MFAQQLFEDVVLRAAVLVSRRQPTTDVESDGDRYVAASGSSWTVEELVALARESLVDEPED